MPVARNVWQQTLCDKLDREHNLALLKKHIDESVATGASMDELCQVIPLSVPHTTVRSLLRTLKKRGLADFQGQSRAARWFGAQTK